MENSISRHSFVHILTFTLLCTIVSGCAITKTKPPKDPELSYTWGAGSSGQARKVTGLKKCANKSCTDVDFKNLDIWLKTTGDQRQKSEVEVCHNSSNPFIQRCDVYDCYEDHAAQQSVCDFLYDYNKNCMSEQCSN